MKNAIFQIKSEKDTEKFGVMLASLVKPGDVIGLKGDLGAGKTFLSRIVSRQLGVPEDFPVNSPTFTLINEYPANIPIYHMDLYRLTGADELYDLGLWEYYEGEGLCLVEWCDKFEDLWPEQAMTLTLELGEEENRTFRAKGKGRAAELVTALSEMWSRIKK